MDDLFGTEPYKLHRKAGSDTSKEAAYSIETSRLEKLVYNAICSCKDGCIASDLLHMFPGLAYSSITARFSALERKGLIVCGPDKRAGKSGRQQRVMRKK